MSSLSPSVRWAELRISLSLELSERERNQEWERWAAHKTVECSNEKGTYSKEGGDLVRGRAWGLGSESPEQFHSTIITIAPQLPALLNTHSSTKKLLLSQSYLHLFGIDIVYLMVRDTQMASEIYFSSFSFFKVISTLNVGLEPTTPTSRVACSTA